MCRYVVVGAVQSRWREKRWIVPKHEVNITLILPSSLPTVLFKPSIIVLNLKEVTRQIVGGVNASEPSAENRSNEPSRRCRL